MARLTFIFLAINITGLLNASTANHEQIVVRHTDLDLVIDFDRKVLRGTARLNIEKLKKTAELWLNSALLNVKAIRGDLKSWELRAGERGLGEFLVIKTLNKDNLTITIEYETSPEAPGLIWLNADQTRSGEPMLISMNEPVGARSWFPCQDTPAVRGTYSANLKIIANNRKSKAPLMALISGENNPHQSNASMRYEHLSCRKIPIPSYLFALAAGHFVYAQLSDTIGFYADTRESLDKALVGSKDADRFFATLTEILGPSPWPHQNFLLIPSVINFGGMENPMLIYLNEDLMDERGSMSYILAHELAHMWTGNLVTQQGWDALWLNESWSTYYEDRVLEAVYGKEFANDNAVITFQDLLDGEQTRMASQKEPISQPTRMQKQKAKNINPNNFIDFSIYAKGTSMLRTIEDLIGRKRFDRYSQDYLANFHLRPINSKKFIDFSVAKLKALRADIDWPLFFHEWIYKPGLHPNTRSIKIAAVNLPDSKSFEDKVREFYEKDNKTDFNRWNHFQILYLLRTLERSRKNKENINDKITLLGNCPSFLDMVMRYANTRKLWGAMRASNPSSASSRHKLVLQ
jgi:leukotriene-A4 hydrolase